MTPTLKNGVVTSAHSLVCFEQIAFMFLFSLLFTFNAAYAKKLCMFANPNYSFLIDLSHGLFRNEDLYLSDLNMLAILNNFVFVMSTQPL